MNPQFRRDQADSAYNRAEACMKAIELEGHVIPYLRAFAAGKGYGAVTVKFQDGDVVDLRPAPVIRDTRDADLFWPKSPPKSALAPTA